MENILKSYERQLNTPTRLDDKNLEKIIGVMTFPHISNKMIRETDNFMYEKLKRLTENAFSRNYDFCIFPTRRKKMKKVNTMQNSF